MLELLLLGRRVVVEPLDDLRCNFFKCLDLFIKKFFGAKINKKIKLSKQILTHLIAFADDLLHVLGGDLVLHLRVLDRLLHVEGVRFECVLRRNAVALLFIIL